MTKREIVLKEIKEEADKFFEYPTADKSHVSTTSMILFVEHMLNRTRPEQIKCRKCEVHLNEPELTKYAAYQQNYPETHQFAMCQKCVDAMLGKNESTASAAWSDFDEKRLEIIGQNGNGGEHYER